MRTMKMSKLVLAGVGAWALGATAGEISLSSPGNVTALTVRDGEYLTWEVRRNGETVLDGASRLGLKFAGKESASNWVITAEAPRRVADEFATPLYKKEKIALDGQELKIVRQSDILAVVE